MNSEQFVSMIKLLVRDSAIEDTLENLSYPPGRNVSEIEQQLSNWLNALSLQDR